ncbi:MAG: hypothetical protein ACYYKD_10835 [Rhodospirillales bacterium]
MAAADSGRPRQANLRRAVSTAYYALFHCLARSCADLFIGTSKNTPAWHQVYRALEHGPAANACKTKAVVEKFPQEIQDFADVFTDMQNKRHSADYSLSGSFLKPEVLENINNVESIIRKYESVDIKHRRAFAAFVLFKARRG